jgi:TonB family protein
MRVLWFVALFVGLGISFSGGQQTISPTSSPVPDSQPARVKVYTLGPGVIAPELIPPNLAPIPIGNCKNKMDGKVVLSVLVDESGQPRNIMFLKPLGTDLDKLALKLVTADRFKPGTHDGAPVVVGLSVDVVFQACIDEITDDAGKKATWLRLRFQPEQKLGNPPHPPEHAVLTVSTLSLEDTYKASAPLYRVGGKVSAPVPINNVVAEFGDEAKRAKYEGVCIFSLVIDVHGMPQNVRIVKPLDYGLTEKAIDAVSKSRFKPAMRNGEPVPVMVNFEVEFHLI